MDSFDVRAAAKKKKKEKKRGHRGDNKQEKEYSQRAHFRTSHSLPDLFMAESVDIKIVGLPAWRWKAESATQTVLDKDNGRRTSVNLS